jgi:CelD/BcsL family acetyltransferase involved in cellulose biosynthesis
MTISSGEASGVTVRVLPGRGLDDGLMARWSELQRIAPPLSSPFFCPEFTAIVADVREDVHVGVLEREGQPVGFFPFQRGRFGLGSPVGSMLSDYHGAIVESGVRWDAGELVDACGLKTWEFDHLIASQEPFAPFHRLGHSSPVMDLSCGIEAYLHSRESAGVREISAVARKRRKLEREHGEVRFAQHVADGGALDTLMRWKSDQYQRTGAADHLSEDWVREVLRLAHMRQTPAFAGMLSALYVEDRMVAAHFGMRSTSVWHYWYPAYDPEFGAYSPGLVLLLDMARSAPSLGIRTIDLGKGDARYKRALASRSVAVAEGAIARRSLAAAAWRLRHDARAVARRTAMGPRLRRLVRGLRLLGMSADQGQNRRPLISGRTRS